MKTRPLLRTDLPKKRSTCDSLHIPVLLKNKKRFICDIHFANDHLCYLENAKGIPTRIRNLQLINLSQHVQKLQREIMKLKSELSL
jgi:hypothetical protein